jgi:hypothetical protein
MSRIIQSCTIIVKTDAVVKLGVIPLGRSGEVENASSNPSGMDQLAMYLNQEQSSVSGSKTIITKKIISSLSTVASGVYK